MILPGFWRRSQSRTIGALYGAIVAQARSATFYADYRVPDTVDGRFDLLVLHLVLLLRRLDQQEGLERQLGQDLFDAFCRDLDANLREMGVGDFTVPKRMQGFAEAFYGRQAAYLAALAGPDPRDFEMALARNIFAGVGGAGAACLATYGRAALAALEGQTDEGLLRGQVVFPKPEAFVREPVQ
jgi:cytochrome b pre-mRNA-processing protein 3